MLTTSFTTAELVLGLGIALLFSLGPVGSVHFIVSGLDPAFVQGGFFITGSAITSPEEDFLNYTLSQKCLTYEMCTRCEEMSPFLFFW